MRTKTLDYYKDPDNEWIKVSIRCPVLKSILHKISNASYYLDTNVYLEKDTDAEIYFNAVKESGKYNLNFRYHNSDTPSEIRSYDSVIFFKKQFGYDHD